MSGFSRGFEMFWGCFAACGVLVLLGIGSCVACGGVMMLGGALTEPEPAPRFRDLEYHRADGDPEKILEFTVLATMVGRTGALHNCDEFKWNRISEGVYVAMCGKDDTTDIPRYWMVFPHLNKVNGPFHGNTEVPGGV